jgi:hypothetical protein
MKEIQCKTCLCFFTVLNNRSRRRFCASCVEEKRRIRSNDDPDDCVEARRDPKYLFNKNLALNGVDNMRIINNWIQRHKEKGDYEQCLKYASGEFSL